MATIEPYHTTAGRRYQVRYRKPDRTQTKKRGFRTKRDAELFLASVEVSKARGEFIDAMAAKALIGPLGAAWLARQTHLKPSAYRPLESAWRIHVLPAWGSVAVADVRKTAVQQWVSEMTLGDPGATPARKPKGATLVIRAYGVLASILDDAVSDRRTLSNPARGVSLPRKVKKPHVYLTHEQVHALAAASKYPGLVLVLAYCGIRWGEATALRVKHLDMLRRRLMIEENAVQVGSVIELGTPKNHKKRTVPFPRFLGEHLARQCEGKARDDLVFPGENGHHLRLARVHEDNMSWFGSAVKRTGIPRITPHDLRHSAASFAVSAGANVKVVQKMLGHSSAAMTLDTYADLFDGDLDSVSDALDHAVSLANVPKMCPPA
ncbi:Putative prophage phiRv2 integrase [Arthrobacter sp. Bi83]|uniref:tyrosine-type recombinase/integrase n=1 Tax=Arthrobacter sp. Bi83 TaxID=2822353 RepID=UPI001DC1A2A8|nr:tyrosine-type recombinase/integrase [Arthrobacter sp. Bi83]CAH0274625.1 Putative prophage phiRv2 integrase [Arthrobacter sp. Bi83]